MTDHEIQLLALGGALGSYLTLLGHMLVIAVTEGRRLSRNLARAERALAKNKATNDWRQALAGRRAEPHPAELLEASVRGFELNLYDAIDHVEDAMRKDGLL
ncbi:hypothetical protein [Streptomyces sp. UG1]|uniref:hypothetical protein n=1 Tax=Streptomyces sp. UG1 TaxID=3417652 RepID=UPI003CF88090